MIRICVILLATLQFEALYGNGQFWNNGGAANGFPFGPNGSPFGNGFPFGPNGSPFGNGFPFGPNGSPFGNGFPFGPNGSPFGNGFPFGPNGGGPQNGWSGQYGPGPNNGPLGNNNPYYPSGGVGQCFNRNQIGGYPIGGYPVDAFNNPIVSNGNYADFGFGTANKVLCDCNCGHWNWVCGNDGLSYVNRCSLDCRASYFDRGLALLYWGVCTQVRNNAARGITAA